MDSDRELLELAAKAVGYELEWEEVGEDDPDCGPCWFCVIRGTRAIWDPLTNDGDALRLAVKLGLDVSFYPEFPGCYSAFSRSAWYVDEERYGECDEPQGDDPAAATRRAIVRAAAEIGREPGGRNG